jgi:putative addiction module component (TIGR02574 family)
LFFKQAAFYTPFMTMNILDTAKSLPLSERIELAEALWESIIQDGYEPEVTTAQAEELDRRLAAHEKNPDDVVAWETVKSDLETKYGKS